MGCYRPPGFEISSEALKTRRPTLPEKPAWDVTALGPKAFYKSPEGSQTRTSAALGGGVLTKQASFSGSLAFRV